MHTAALSAPQKGGATWQLWLRPLCVLESDASTTRAWLRALRENAIPEPKLHGSGSRHARSTQHSSGATSTATQLGRAREALVDNLDELNGVAERTDEMRSNASSFAAMARQAAQQQQRKGFFGF